MVYMSTDHSSSRLDRFVDLLLDKKHPFWKDERQRAVYNEAAAAALMLQSFLIVFVGAIGLLVVGKPALGLVTAIVLCGSVGQYLIMAILNRRHVDLFPSGWQRQTSLGRRVVAALVALFYVACVLWVLLDRQDEDTRHGLLVGGVFGLAVWGGIAIALLYKKNQKQ
jgi:uncharacterized BrkB/YihY/UPF0761 family membrane protein